MSPGQGGISEFVRWAMEITLFEVGVGYGWGCLWSDFLGRKKRVYMILCYINIIYIVFFIIIFNLLYMNWKGIPLSQYQYDEYHHWLWHVL